MNASVVYPWGKKTKQKTVGASICRAKQNAGLLGGEGLGSELYPFTREDVYRMGRLACSGAGVITCYEENNVYIWAGFLPLLRAMLCSTALYFNLPLLVISSITSSPCLHVVP